MEGNWALVGVETTVIGMAVVFLILIILMFVGRVGGLTILWSAIPGKGGIPSRLPEGKIAIG